MLDDEILTIKELASYLKLLRKPLIDLYLKAASPVSKLVGLGDSGNLRLIAGLGSKSRNKKE